MCRSSNMNAYALQAPVNASAIGLHDLTASLSSCTNALVAAATPSTAQTSTQNKGRKHNSRHPHIVVEHHYHDHANEHDLVDERPARGGVTTPFPIRLHKMLDKMEADGHVDVISWQPHGRCFVVRKPKEFKELLPIYFKLSKMASFQRQLNLYGFQRLTRGRDKNGYYHEYFLRGRPALSHKIQRTKVKGTGVRARSSPATEPHLWEMPWVGTEQDAQHYTHHNDDAGSVSTQEDETNDDFGTPKASPAVPAKNQAAATVMSSVAGGMGSLPAPPAMPTQAASASMPPLVTPQTAASAVQYNNWGQSSHQQQQPQLYLSSMTSSNDVQQQQQQVEQENRVMMAMTQQMRDEISLFGKTFHYLDPREMVQEAEVRKQQVEACQKQQQMRFPSQEAFMSNLELDNLYSEIDNDRMDNDDAFMDMLERVIE